MTYLKYIITLYVIVLIASCSNVKVDSRISFDKDYKQEFLFKSTVDLKTGQSMEDITHVEFSLLSSVDSIYEIVGIVKRKQIYSTMFGEVDIDTDKEINESELSESELDVFSDIRKYLKKEFVFKLSDRGNVIEKPKFIVDGNSPYPISSYYYNCQITFPNASLCRGLEWTEEKVNSALSSGRSVIQYRVESITDELITINAKKETFYNVMGQKSSTIVKGNYFVSAKDRHIVKYEEKVNLSENRGESTSQIRSLGK